jgi:RNA polymerase sigma-70 factor (ECF subfamily)
MIASDPAAVCTSGKVATLLETAREGRLEVLGPVFEGYREYLRWIIRARHASRCVPNECAMDLIQETYLQGLRAFASFRGTTDAELRAWLRRILLNKLADYQLDIAGHAAQFERDFDLTERDTPDPLAVDRDDLVQLQGAITRLPDEYREIVILRYWKSRSWQEIGEYLHKSADAARMLNTRAIRQMRRLLNSGVVDGGGAGHAP